MHLYRKRLAGNARNRRDVADEIEIELVVEGGVDRVHESSHKERISVRGRVYDHLGADIAGSSWSVPLVLVVGGFYPLLYKHHRGECRFNGGMLGGMVRTLKTPSGMTRVRPSIERVQMLQSSSGVIQLALTPVFLLTAVAALLNVFSTRLGRVADRVDLLSGDLKHGAADTEFLSAQLDFLRRRSLILDVAVVLATVGGAATCAAALVLFFGTLRDAEFRTLVFGLFGGAIIFTITALVTFAIEMIMAGLGLRGVMRHHQKTADQNKSDPKTC